MNISDSIFAPLRQWSLVQGLVQRTESSFSYLQDPLISQALSFIVMNDGSSKIGVDQLQRKVVRQARKLRFLTDQDIARKYCKKPNQEQVEYSISLIKSLVILDCELDVLNFTAREIKKELELLKFNYLETEKAFQNLHSQSPSLFDHSFLIHLPFTSLKAIDEKITEISKYLYGIWYVQLEKKEKNWQSEMNEFSLNKKKIDALKEKLASPLYQKLPVSLKDISVYPPLLWQFKGTCFTFIAKTWGIQIHFTPHVYVQIDAKAPSPSKEEIERVLVSISKGLAIPLEVLREEIETKGWQWFLKERLLLNTQIDFQSQSILEKLVLQRKKLLAQSLDVRDLQDVVSLSRFKEAVTLNCGHTFSLASLHQQNNCPCCRQKIDYIQLLPNPFLSQLSLIFKRKQLNDKINQLEKNLKTAKDNYQFMVTKRLWIEQEKAKRNECLKLFKYCLAIYGDLKSRMGKQNVSYQTFIESLHSGLNTLEKTISSNQITRCLNQEKLEANRLIATAKWREKTKKLLTSYQQGDLNATLIMNDTRKTYSEKLRQKLEKTRAILAIVQAKQEKESKNDALKFVD